ncbi:peptidase [Streptomyces agglomeratus]|uniref:S9 family peptidase n=1 Tax=Streptomyces agglomeratus TaxID=285458 RepID=UPI000854EDDC|nr:prolyl oligopeptidase family serine peptidase [Streptomyces agglomeratus]OEJ41991.1 peptidase [Streptomyces agglomeratus]OEJ43631.1 peptidase [Streptomyces agglomeratus]OEJ61852.1 peptidase [Streptomyces agglomeratus]
MAPDARNPLIEERRGRQPRTAPAAPARVAAVPTGTPGPPGRPASGGPPPFTSTAPATVPLPDARGLRDAPAPLVVHGCWYPSADPTGEHVAFICDRGGVPQLWTSTADGTEAHLLDSDPDPVTEVSWSPDGHWIAYTSAPGGGEHTRVLCVRPDGTGRRVLAGAEPGQFAHLGCWTRDGAALAVTVAEPAAAPPEHGPAAHVPDEAPTDVYAAALPPGWAERDGRATLLGAGGRGEAGPAAPPANGGLAAYLVDPEGTVAPVLLAAEAGAASLRVCDISADGRLALLRHGPRGRREAMVVRTADARTAGVVPVADGDPWIGRFAPDARTLWLRSDADREFPVLLAATLGADGECLGLRAAAEREAAGLELLTVCADGTSAVLAWNVHGASELETVALPGAGDGGAPSARAVPLPHEVVTRIAATGPDGMFLALSGSRRRPGVWRLPDGATPVRTGWSARDEDAAPPGRPPVRPEPVRLRARDGLPLGGWYYRAPGRDPGRPAPCVIHLHGGPEEQERPVFNPLYHELLGRGLDVFAPDVRGSSGWGRSFVDADLGTGRFAAIDDVADCAAHAVGAGLADPTRLAVMGRSYGGYLVLASLVWHPDLFRTGVAVCGMSDFATFFAGTEQWIAQSAAAKYGHPEHDRELLRALSPMSRVDALRAPLLAVHGEYDTNVPPGESEQIVRAARERGVPAELLLLRNEGHDFLRADNRRLFRRAAADWMERHLND